MEYAVKSADGVANIGFTLSKAEWDGAVEQAYQRTKGKYQVGGFRKGKAPKKVIEMHYGAGVFIDEAFNSVFPEVYGKMLDKEPALYPVDAPDVELEEFLSGGGIKFKAKITLKPEFKLPEYKGLTVPAVEYKVTDKDVDGEIDAVRERNCRKISVKDRPLQKGDFAIIDYSGSVDGVKFAGGTAERQELEIGSGSFIDGFEAKTVGMKIGEERAINVKFPDAYHAEGLKGKDAVFLVKLHDVQTKELPEKNDDFAKDVSKFDTFKEYRADLKARLEDGAKRKTDAENEGRLIDAVAGKAQIKIPACMVETQLDYMLEDFAERLSYQGMKLEDYFRYAKTTPEDFKRARKTEAERIVKTRLVVEAIVKAEKIEADKEDIDAKLAEYAKAAGKTLAEYKKNAGGERLNYIKNEVVTDKLLKLLKASNTLKVEKTDKAENADKPADKPEKETGAKGAAGKTDRK